MSLACAVIEVGLALIRLTLSVGEISVWHAGFYDISQNEIRSLSSLVEGPSRAKVKRELSVLGHHL